MCVCRRTSQPEGRLPLHLTQDGRPRPQQQALDPQVLRSHVRQQECCHRRDSTVLLTVAVYVPDIAIHTLKYLSISYCKSTILHQLSVGERQDCKKYEITGEIQLHFYLNGPFANPMFSQG